jgi:ankyrin repeat protein
MFFSRNSSGSTPLHLAAATGHTAVVEYLLSQRGMGRVKAALDSEGKSPLALCLEFKMNDWQRSAEILKEAYKVRRSTSLQTIICLLSLNF